MLTRLDTQNKSSSLKFSGMYAVLCFLIGYFQIFSQAAQSCG